VSERNCEAGAHPHRLPETGHSNLLVIQTLDGENAGDDGAVVSKDTVHRVWQEAGLKPHRLERYMASDDPEFETKAADIFGLYLRAAARGRVLRR